MKINARSLATGGLIAAAYVVLTLLASLAGMSSGIFQIRISEALCILPLYTSAAVPGLFIGCIIANLITGAGIWDIIIGSIATGIGALGTYFVSRRTVSMKFLPRHILASLPPVISNTVLIPVVLVTIGGIRTAFSLAMLLIFAGEVVSVGVLGFFFSKAMSKLPSLFR